MSDALSDEEIEATLAALVRGAAALIDQPDWEGWGVSLREGRLWYSYWFNVEHLTLDEHEREIEADEVRALLRRHGRRVIHWR